MNLGRSSTLGLAMAAASCLLLPSAADETEPAVEVEMQSRFIADAQLGPTGGRVSQWSNLVDLSLPVAGSGKSGVGVDLIVQHLDLRFRDFGEFMPGRSAPVVAANVVTLQPAAIFPVTPRWSFVGSGTLQFAGADGAPWGDSSLRSGSVGALYQDAPQKKIGLGVQVAERMKAPALILPFPLIDWQISNRWSLTTMDGTSGRLRYRVTAALNIVGRLEFRLQDLRLSGSSSIPSGILRYEAFPLSIGVEYRPNKHVTISADGGAAIAQRFRFLDERGHRLATSSTRPPWMGTLDVDFGF